MGLDYSLFFGGGRSIRVASNPCADRTGSHDQRLEPPTHDFFAAQLYRQGIEPPGRTSLPTAIIATEWRRIAAAEKGSCGGAAVRSQRLGRGVAPRRNGWRWDGSVQIQL